MSYWERKAAEARTHWEGMKPKDPEGCAKVEKAVKRNMASAAIQGRFGKAVQQRRLSSN